MRIHKLFVLVAFLAVCSIPACSCNSGPSYLTSPEADVTSTETAPSSEAVE